MLTHIRVLLKLLPFIIIVAGCGGSTIPGTEIPTESPVISAPQTATPTEIPVTAVPKTAIPTEIPVTVIPKTATPTEIPVTVVPKTATPTEIPATATPVASPTETRTTLMFQEIPALEKITVENADQVQLLVSLPIDGYSEYRWHQCNTAFSPDGQYLSGACGRSNVPVWDVNTLKLQTTLYDSPTSVVSCEFSPDSRLLACAGFQFRDVTVWNVESGERLHRFRVNSNAFDVDFSPDGTRLVAASVFSINMNTGEERSGAIHMWNLSTGELLWENETDTPRSFISVSFHPNGETIAWGKERGGAGIMDAETGEVLLHFDKEGNTNIGDLTYSPSGRLLAIARDDYKIYIWDTSDYHLLATLDGHQHYVNGVVFNTDETLLISGAGENDRTLGIWAVEDFQLLTQLSRHTDSVLRVDINTAGTLIASISWDGTVRIWGIPAN